MRRSLTFTIIFGISCSTAGAWNALDIRLPGMMPLRETNRYDAVEPIERQLGAEIPDLLRDLDLAPKQYRSARHPWMHRSWKMHSGMIGGRYLDSKFNALKSFAQRREYIRRNPMADVARPSGPFRSSREREVLSPAEKYDLLVGDMNSTLATSMWRLGEDQMEKGGIGDWMGLCDGSAGATAVTAEPVKSVTLRDPVYGRDLKFFASDIKALASLLYSEFVVTVPIVGGRCDRDKIGAVPPGHAPECESLNPATWHRALLHLVGERGDTLFMDHTASREVWNTPVIAYEFKYLNPETGKQTSRLTDALVPLERLRSDARRSLRSPSAHSIVGVSMLVYVAGGSTSALEGAQPAKSVKMGYTYDLELDSLGRLVGGEWHTATHPDFIWTLARDFEPETIADTALGRAEWDGRAIPESWLGVLRDSSAKSQPMAAIIKRLIRLSAQ